MKTKLVLAVLLAGVGCAAYTAFHPLSGAEPLTSSSRSQGEPDNPSDRLSWLGPVPANLTEDDVVRRMDRIAEKIRNDLSSPPDIMSFTCRKPAAVGPIPMMDAVERYIDGLPESQDNDALLRNLHEAARQGNWLARVQIYALISGRQAADPKSVYRVVQLQEWMQAHRIGALYATFGDALAASGFYSDVPGDRATGIDIFAALHDSYPAQNKVGKELVQSGDPRLVDIGKKMLACASASLPAYARVFSGEAEKAREDSLRKAEEATYSPLHRAVRDNDAARVAKLLATAGVDVNARTSRDQTPLDMALLSSTQSAPIIKQLIEHGAEVVNHGAVDRHVGKYDREELLNRAVKARPANLEIVAMLTKAGAEAFKTDEVNETIVSTPFADSFELYESGQNTGILDFFLATKMLDPDSRLALEYLEHAARYPKVLDRLLAYRVRPDRSKDMLSELVSASTTGHGSVDEYLRVTSKLVRDYPALARSLKDKPGNRALIAAVYDCNFAFANWLLDAGTPMEQPDPARAGELVQTIVERCDRDPAQEADHDAIENMHRLRKTFLEKLHAKGYDFNVNIKIHNCPAWLSSGGLCETPKSDELAEQFLALGADPYRLYADQRGGALNSVISACRTKILDLMLAAPPRKSDGQAQKALDLALEETTRPVWSGLNCPSDFLSKTARRLVSYGAHPERSH